MSENFLKKLQQEAELQALLEEKRVLPRGLGVVFDFVATFSWQVLLVMSFLTAVFISVSEVML